MTEKEIQLILWYYLQRKRHSAITPNAHLYRTGEMDMCSVMKSGKVCEYEIKISVADFKADFKKPKHHMFNQRLAGIDSEPYRWNRDGVRKIVTPNYFYYVVPRNLIQASDLPDYAGLIYIDQRMSFKYFPTQVKKALELHREIDQFARARLGDKLMYRYWNLRSNGKDDMPVSSISSIVIDTPE